MCKYASECFDMHYREFSFRLVFWFTLTVTNMHACMHKHACTHTYACTHTRTHAYITHKHAWAHTHTHMHIYITHMHAWAHTHTHAHNITVFNLKLHLFASFTGQKLTNSTWKMSTTKKHIPVHISKISQLYSCHKLHITFSHSHIKTNNWTVSGKNWRDLSHCG